MSDLRELIESANRVSSITPIIAKDFLDEIEGLAKESPSKDNVEACAEVMECIDSGYDNSELTKIARRLLPFERRAVLTLREIERVIAFEVAGYVSDKMDEYEALDNGVDTDEDPKTVKEVM